MDGIDGDECEFELTINPNPSGEFRGITHSPPDQNLCIGVEVCFEIERDLLNEKYRWKLPPSDSIVSGGGIDDMETCMYFKSSGEKEVYVEVEAPCGKIVDFSNSIFIKPGQSISVDTIYTDKPNYCGGDSVEFQVSMENPDNLDFVWSYDPSNTLSSIYRQDTFLKAKIWRADTFDIAVTPVDECGFIYTQEVPVTTNLITQLTRNICDGFCFQLGDSCYYESDFSTINTGLANSIGCDSLVRLTINVANVLPSPLVKCKPVQDGVLVEWEEVSGADSYLISIDRDSFTTITDNFILLENINMDSTVNVKIQPFGACTYLPGEINCLNGISTTVPNFSNNEIIVFPNPTTGEINIKTDLKIESVEVFDVAGRFLQKEINSSFDLKNRTAGIYFLKIKTNRGVGVKRVLVSLK